MRTLKVSLSLLNFFLASMAFGQDASRTGTHQKLLNVAAAIQNYEAQLSAVEHDLAQAHAEENAILAELGQYNQQLMETIHYLRHATQYSPLLAMLSASGPEDVIHSSVLLRSVTPEIHARNQRLLEKLRALSHVRAQLETKQTQLHEITFRYHQERETLDSLLTTRQPQETLPESCLENPLEVLTLIRPVAGKLVPTYKNPDPEWSLYTQGVLFKTRPGAHVVSPLSGKVAFAGEYAKGQGKMVIIETARSHVVLSGLETLNCKEGQAVMAGHPLGQMPTKGQNIRHLYLEVWQQEQTINPQTLFKE